MSFFFEKKGEKNRKSLVANHNKVGLVRQVLEEFMLEREPPHEPPLLKGPTVAQCCFSVNSVCERILQNHPRQAGQVS
jgi:hypothetical protein